MSPVLCGGLQLSGLRNGQPGRATSPVPARVAFAHVWTERAAVGQPRVSLPAAGLGRDRGLLLEPPGQLHEAVVRRLSVMVQASGRFVQTLRRRLLQPGALGVRLGRAAPVVLIVL